MGFIVFYELFSRNEVPYNPSIKEYRRTDDLKDLRNQSIEYKKELEQKLKEIEEYLEMAPAGSLHCERRGADVRYFLCDEAEEDQKPGKGKYITKGHDQLVQELAQKKYYERLKPELESEIRFLDRLIQKCEAEKKERVYGEMNYYRKKELCDDGNKSDFGPGKLC